MFLLNVSTDKTCATLKAMVIRKHEGSYQFAQKHVKSKFKIVVSLETYIIEHLKYWSFTVRYFVEMSLYCILFFVFVLMCN